MSRRRRPSRRSRRHEGAPPFRPRLLPAGAGGMTQGFGLSAAARAALLQRLSRRGGQEGAEAPAESLGRDLTTLPGLRDIEMVREAGAALGLENPFFRPHEGVAGARTVIGGREYLNFASYNYFGLNGGPRRAPAAPAAGDPDGGSAP